MTLKEFLGTIIYNPKITFNIVLLDIINDFKENEEVLFSGNTDDLMNWEDKDFYMGITISAIKPYTNEFCVYLRGEVND